MTHIAAVGGGQAAVSLVARLRALGFDGRITMFSRESAPPYERPPLSKKFLLTSAGAGEVAIRPADFYTENDIDLRLSTEVERIDPIAGDLIVGGERVSYDHLVFATGATARSLPGAIGGDLVGVHTLRSIEDAEALRGELQSGRRLLVIGGGYIGLETAATAAQSGLSVTVVELGERILQRVASPALSNTVRTLHRAEGVDIREGVGLTALEGEDRVERATLGDGTVLDIDIAIVGVGAQPNVGLAAEAGLDIENGIRTDEFGRTPHPAIWAAGDCASFPYLGRRIRLESAQNAIDQAEAVAANILGAAAPYQPTPTFWSDQFDSTVQIVGLGDPSDMIAERPGPKAGAVSFWLYGPDGLRAVEVINDPRTFSIARRMIADGKSPPPEAVADEATNLKSLLRC